MTRRDFFRNAALSTAGAYFPFTPSWQSWIPPFYIFSKHLQFLNYSDMADAAAETGFDGIELTVRPGGHVEPEAVTERLPAAIQAIRRTGLKSDMMVTAIKGLDEPLTRSVLKTASTQGVIHYRLGYLRFSDDQDIFQSLKFYNSQMKELAAFNADLDLTGSYQNHSGTMVGAEIWDLYHLLEGIPSENLGCQYDIRHATVEGGTSWTRGLQLIRSKITSVVLKDFVWEKKNGEWRVKNVPLGSGMVDFKKYFDLLKSYQIQVPFTIHYEYDLYGAEHGHRDIAASQYPMIFDALRKDLLYARDLWQDG